MSFGQPTFGNAAGVRDGVTALNGTLAPFINPAFKTRLGADIAAFPPHGMIATTISAGFIAGVAPTGASMLTTILDGTLTMNRSVAETAGGFAAAAADISITIQEWALLGRPPLFLRRKFVRAVTFTPLEFSHIWTVGLGFQAQFQDNFPLLTAGGMPVIPGRQYVIIANLEQSAQCELGVGAAASNIAFDFPPMFFDFT